MVIARNDAAQLIVHSAIALDAHMQTELEALGTLAWLVVPNGHHRLDAAAYKRRYPHMVVVAPEGAVRRISKLVAVDQTYAEFAQQPELRLEHAPWPQPREGVMRVRSADGITLVFNDLVFSPPSDGFAGWLFRTLHQGPQVPWLAKRTIAPNVSLLRDWLLLLSQTADLVRVVPGHGPPILHKPAETLRGIAAQL